MFSARALFGAAGALALGLSVSACGWFDILGGTRHLGCGDFGADLKLEHGEGREVDYVVDCLAEVDAVELEIGEGVILEFAAGAGLTLGPAARLTAVSIGAPTIVLRGTEPRRGYWKGLRFETTGQGHARLLNVSISDAGALTDPAFKGALTVVGQVSLGSVQLRNIEGIGVWVDEAGLLTDFAAITIEGCSSYPVRVAPQGMGHIERGNTYRDNAPDRILVASGTIDTAVVPDPGVPYEISGDIDIIGSLNLEDTNTWLMADDVRLRVTGSLSTDRDGHVTFSALNRVRGAWQGLWIAVDNAPPESPLNLHDLTVEYAGGGTLFPANVSIERGRVDLQDGFFQHSASCGVRYDQSSVELRDLGGNTFADNAGGDLCPQ
ncbi:MAG: hypothetical protein ABIJ09_12505 [Pseudomonadota bacterium]